MEEYGEVWNEWYETPEAAQVAYEAFITVTEAPVAMDREGA